jgi:hypothetical protein
MARNPYRKPVHLAAKVDQEGNVSAMCFKRPHAIDLTRASWTIRGEAVTCHRCRVAAKAEGKPGCTCHASTIEYDRDPDLWCEAHGDSEPSA